MKFYTQGIEWLVSHLPDLTPTITRQCNNGLLMADHFTFNGEEIIITCHLEETLPYWTVNGGEKEFGTIQNLAMHLSTTYGINITFSGGVLEDIDANLYPFSHHMFRNVTKHPVTGSWTTILVFDPSQQLAMVPRFDLTQCCILTTNGPLHSLVMQALQARKRELMAPIPGIGRTNAMSPKPAHRLHSTYSPKGHPHV